MITVGTTVKLKTSCFGMPPGTIGVCYETYTIGEHEGVSIIFKTGGYDGFSLMDQAYFLEKIEDTDFTYFFKSVMTLARDFDRGVFNQVLGIDPIGIIYT
jgi:hypothetical protein